MEHYFSEKPTSTEKLIEIKEVLRGLEFKFFSSPGIFSKKRIDKGTKLLVETMIVFDDWKVLDLGCGYGVIGIVASKLGAKEVWLSDVNERALELAKLNCKINKVKNAKIIKSNLFENIVETFDTIITNPPYTAGKEVIKRIVEESYEHLKERGVIQLVTTRKFKYVEKILNKIFDDVYLLSRDGDYLVYAGFKIHW